MSNSEIKILSLSFNSRFSSLQACNAIGMIGMNHPNDGRNHPKDPCHCDEVIPMDGGWLPHWDEALDESTGIIEAVFFAPYLYRGRSPPITTLQNTQPQLSQVIPPKPPNGATYLHPLG